MDVFKFLKKKNKDLKANSAYQITLDFQLQKVIKKIERASFNGKTNINITMYEICPKNIKNLIDLGYNVKYLGYNTYIIDWDKQILDSPINVNLNDLIEKTFYCVKKENNTSYIFKHKNIEDDMIMSYSVVNLVNKEKYNEFGVCDLKEVSSVRLATNDEIIKYFPEEFN